MLACSECKGVLDASYNAPDQRPCPRCGSKRRTIHVSTIETVEVESFAKVRVRSGERKKGKPLIETYAGDELHNGRGRWHTITEFSIALKICTTNTS